MNILVAKNPAMDSAIQEACEKGTLIYIFKDESELGETYPQYSFISASRWADRIEHYYYRVIPRINPMDAIKKRKQFLKRLKEEKVAVTYDFLHNLQIRIKGQPQLPDDVKIEKVMVMDVPNDLYYFQGSFYLLSQ